MKENNMKTLLSELTNKWSESSDYKDIQAFEWHPGLEREENCPKGCRLQIYEETIGWSKVQDRDAYRQTRICRKHGFARIYVISGPTAEAHKWNPNQEGG